MRIPIECPAETTGPCDIKGENRLSIGQAANENAASQEKQCGRLFAKLWSRFAVLAALACVPGLLGFLSGMWWRFELLSHFRVQYAIVLGALTIPFLVARRFRFAAVPGACALINIALILPLYFGPSNAEADGPKLRILSANVLTSNASHERVIRLIHESEADVVFLMEVNERWVRALDPLQSEYPHWHARPREDNFGVAFLSRVPLAEAEIMPSPKGRVPFVRVRLEREGRTVTLFGLHTLPPVSRRAAGIRNEQMAEAALHVREGNDPVIVVGDLNMTSWSPAFRRFVRDTGLRDSRRGFGVQPTWPAFNPVLRVPIDHCLVSAKIVVRDRQVGPAVGSDHFPILIDVVVR